MSLKKAITTFERQGGSVNVIVCDDGLQLASPEDRARRIEYYNLNNLAYVARPPHGEDGFLRRGRFKKAGNLNHCNTLSLKIEDVLEELRPSPEQHEGPWREKDENELYEKVLAQVIEESQGKIWAAGNVRM